MKKLILLIPILLWGLVAFSQVTDVFMTTKATEIKLAGAGQNTADRVGTMFQYLVDSKVNLGQYAFVTATGTDTYAATVFPAITSYTNLRITVKFTNANTGASTLNINSQGAKAIVKEDGSALAVGAIPANSVKTLAYNGTSLQLTGGSGGAALTSGQGTTANGSAADLGGTISSLRTINYGTTGLILESTASGGSTSSIASFKNVGSAPLIELSTNNGAFGDLTYRSSLVVTSTTSSSLLRALAYNSTGSFAYQFKMSHAGIQMDVLPGSDAAGDLLVRGSSGLLQPIAAVATGNTLISNGVGNTFGWGKVGLTTHVSGILPVANGGTGTATPALVAGTNITITGTWPNNTINSGTGVSLASQAEVNAGTDNTKAVSPLTLLTKFSLNRTVTGTDAIIQSDNQRLIYFNSATPFNFTIDQLTIDSYVNFINIGAGTVTFVNGSGVTYSGASFVINGGSGLILYRSATVPIILSPTIGWINGATTLSVPNTVTGTTTNTLKFIFSSLGTTLTNGAGAWFSNTAPAINGSQQISPLTVWEGQGFATTPNVSQSAKFAAYNLPIQSTTNTVSQLVFASSVDGGAYASRMSINSSGILSVLTVSTLTTNSPLALRSQQTSTAGIGVQIANGAINFTASSGTVSQLGIGLVGESFAPTSGTAPFNSALIQQTINQTGGANGQIAGVNNNPTITAAVNVTGFWHHPVNPGNISGTNLGLLVESGSALIGGTTLTTSALLDLQSTTQALVLPRMTTTQRDAIVSPSGGMLIYNTTTSAVNNYSGSWGAFGGGISFPLTSSQLTINNPAATFAYTFTAAAIAAARTITLPLLTGNDVMVTADFTQTLTNKTLSSNTIATTQTTGDNSTKLATTAYVEGYALPIPLSLANGGTEIALTDPAAHAIMGWDNTGNIVRFMTIGGGLTYTQATNTLSSSGGGVTNTAASTEIPLSDAVNLIPSTLFYASRTLTMGTGAAGGTITLQAEGSAAAVGFNIFTKGAGSFQFNGTGSTLNNHFFNQVNSLTLNHYSTDNVGAILVLSKLRGTGGSPTIDVNGDALGSLDFQSYDGAATFNTARIRAVLNGTIATNTLPTDLVFYTTATNSLVEAMRISSAGVIKLGTTSTGGYVWTASGTDASGGWVAPSWWSLATGGTLTGANTVTGTTTNILKYSFSSLGTTITDGAGQWLVNPTPATSGNQQQSPYTTWEGQGFATTPVASQSVKFVAYNLPIQSTANPVSNLVFASSQNGGAYTTRMSINSSGIFSIQTMSTVTTNGTLGIRSQQTSTAGAGVQVSNGAVNFTATSGAQTQLAVGLTGESFAPTSGTATFNDILIQQTINQTGGANGQITMINANPTITAAVDVTGFDWNPTNSGNISGNNYGVRLRTGNLLLNLGNVLLGGSGDAGATRSITASGSATDVGLTVTTKGAGIFTIPNSWTSGASAINVTGNSVGIGGTYLTGVSNIAVYDGTVGSTNIAGFSLASIAGDPRVNNANGVNYSIGGSIFDYFTDANNTTTVETDLYSTTTVASTLSTNGDKIFARYSGKFNDATATAQLRIYFGGTLIGDTGVLTVSSTTLGWSASVLIIRTGATTVRTDVTISTPGATVLTYSTETDVTGLTLSNTNILKITGTAGGGTGGSNDITAKLGSAVFIPSAP